MDYFHVKFRVQIIEAGKSPGAKPLLYTRDMVVPVDQVSKKESELKKDLCQKAIQHLARTLIAAGERLDIAKALLHPQTSPGIDIDVTYLDYDQCQMYNPWLTTTDVEIEHSHLMRTSEIEYETETKAVADHMFKNKTEFSNAIDTLRALVSSKNPVWDGDILSKAGRDTLFDLGLATRVICQGEDGYTCATYKGNHVLKEYDRLKSTSNTEQP